MKNSTLALLAFIALTGCSTQRYGRETEVSLAEKQAYDCKAIALESAKTQAFLDSVRTQRNHTSGAHVMGFLGDFGIGNMMEGDAAEESGELRLKQLKELSLEKKCAA